MPRGFIGRPATSYLGQASDAHTRAASSGRAITADAPSNQNLRERRLPFEATEPSGDMISATGRGNSSNIVVSQQAYETITRMISQADDIVGACAYNVSNEIEAICQTIFILPQAVPKCLNISHSVKTTLNQYSAVTESAMLEVRKFAREIAEIG